MERTGDARRIRKVLERRRWWNWWLLAGSSLITVVGLTVALRSLVPERLRQIWPWAATDDVLLVGVSALLTSFIVYLTLQQRATRARIEEVTARSERQSDLHFKRLVSLFEVSHMVAYQSDLQTVFDGIASSCHVVFDAQWASLMLYEPGLTRLVVASCSGEARQNIIGSKVRVGEGVAGWVAKHRRPLFLGPGASERQYPELTFSHPFRGRSMVVPVTVNGELVGVINVGSTEDDGEFSEHDLQTLQVFAEHVGISIRHTQEIAWLKDTISAT